MIRVVIADDHPHVRSALRHVLELEDDFEVVDEAEDGRQAIAAVVRTRPDLVILDYRMPILDGIEVARELARQMPATAMVMLTSEDDPKVREAAHVAGVHTYLLKSGRADELLSTLRAAAEAKTVVVIEAEAIGRDTLPPPRIA